MGRLVLNQLDENRPAYEKASEKEILRYKGALDAKKGLYDLRLTDMERRTDEGLKSLHNHGLVLSPSYELLNHTESRRFKSQDGTTAREVARRKEKETGTIKLKKNNNLENIEIENIDTDCFEGFEDQLAFLSCKTDFSSLNRIPPTLIPEKFGTQISSNLKPMMSRPLEPNTKPLDLSGAEKVTSVHLYAPFCDMVGLVEEDERVEAVYSRSSICNEEEALLNIIAYEFESEQSMHDTQKEPLLRRLMDYFKLLLNYEEGHSKRKNSWTRFLSSSSSCKDEYSC